ncbi:MAG: peptidoglycan editing factor PgeF [Oscillospiraceae bacterium]|nr:peptidoglycan editing factor PgeF [Oscillospiraceae bacterium]
MAFTEKNEGGIIYMCSSELGTRHAFTTRAGGVSTGIFSSLNLGSNIGDPQPNVAENYSRVCALMGAGPDDCCVTKQVHKADVRIVSSADRHPVGAEVPYEADGIVTAERGLPLFCFTADCTPVLLHDPDASVAAAVHCGWRGSTADIIGNAVAKMQLLGAKPENIRAAIGPSISVCCFETDADVPEAIDRWLGPGSGTYYLKSNGKFTVDLKRANALRLISLGVARDHIDVSDECTMCSHEKYWSHRYTRGKRGVQCAVIVL